MVDPWHPDPETVAGISDVVRAQEASRIRGAPILAIPTTDDDSGPEEEEATPAPRKRPIKYMAWLGQQTPLYYANHVTS